MEWLQETSKWVQTYKDMSLIEISIVKNPANPEATLSIAKSFDAKAGTETPEAVSISKSAEDLLKIDAVQTQVIEGETLKNFYDDIGSAYSGEMELTLSEAKESADLDDFDLKFLSTFIQAALDFKGRDKVEMPDSLNKALYG